MAESAVAVMEEELYEEMKKDFLNQVKRNTEYYHKLQNIKDQGALSKRFEGLKVTQSDNESGSPDETRRLSISGKSVGDLLQALLDINGKIADMLAGREGTCLSAGFRDSVISSSSGVSSSRDITETDPTSQPEDPPAGHIPMRPASEFFMERQGAASQTPRRGVSTRARKNVKEPEESEDTSDMKRKSSTSSSEE